MANPPYIAHVVSHTHWDREWYRSFEAFRARLVDLGDAVLDLLERDPEYGPYYWDGQTCVIDDYLEIRPENGQRLRRAFADGRLVTGPWFVQPDEFLVSGEAMIRNLLLGRRMCAEWQTGHQVGYAPDAFGHTSQMPQILRGFGIDNAVFFRGITTDQVASEFLWQAPDGSTVLALKMPDDTAYSNFYYHFRQTLADTDPDLPVDSERVVAEARGLLAASLAERPTTRFLLWMDGVDHILPQPRTPEIIRRVNQALGGQVQARTATLRQHIDAIQAAAPPLATVTGELRVSNRAWRLQALLAHVASSRMHTKQWNQRCEWLLERWAEPWSTFAFLLERRLGPVPDGERRAAYWQRPALGLLRHAWRQLLLNQPHDSICGCSTDQVHRDMINRYERCVQVAEQITGESLARIAARVNTTPASPQPEGLGAIVVFNPLGWERDGDLVEMTLELPAATPLPSLSLRDEDGLLPVQMSALPPSHRLSQAPHDIPVGQSCQRWAARFPVRVPAFGWSTVWIYPGPDQTAATAVAATADSLDNGLLRVQAASDGSLTLTDLATGRQWPGCLVFEDGGDLGDGYNYVAPAQDQVRRTATPAPGETLTVETEADAVEGRLRLRRGWQIPACRRDNGRSQDQVVLELTATVRLRPAAHRVEIDLEVVNRAADHRLRVLFPSHANAAVVSHVEQAFDVVARPVARPDCSGWREPQPATGPQKTFVDVADEDAGLCVVNVGLPECEVMDDEPRTVAITLLRCTGQGVGAPDEQTEGQMQGTYAFRLALFPHAGSWQQACVWQQAHAVNAPLRGVQTGTHAGLLEAQGSFLQVAPTGQVPTAVKITEDETGWLVRTVNYGDREVELRLASHFPLTPATVSDLAEAADGAPVDLQADRGPTCRSRAITTIRMPLA